MCVCIYTYIYIYIYISVLGGHREGLRRFTVGPVVM